MEKCVSCHYYECGECGIEVCRYDGKPISSEEACHKNDGKNKDKKLEDKKIVTLIAHDFYVVSDALYNIDDNLITFEMNGLRCRVFDLDDRSGELLDCSLADIIPILDELKKHIDEIPDHPYYRSSLERLKKLFGKGYEKASEVYEEKLAAGKTPLGATSEEMKNAIELLSSVLGGF